MEAPHFVETVVSDERESRTRHPATEAEGDGHAVRLRMNGIDGVLVVSYK